MRITKKITQRTCIACRQVKPKRELIRLVATEGGDIEIDISGKKAGRGAYLCRDKGCWNMELRGNQLGYSLRRALSPEAREKLKRHLESLLPEEKR